MTLEPELTMGIEKPIITKIIIPWKLDQDLLLLLNPFHHKVYSENISYEKNKIESKYKNVSEISQLQIKDKQGTYRLCLLLF